MKGGPTVVQGTPVGQADMTVPRGFTSGLCDCCNDGKTCLAVWCCSPITTAQLWQYTFGQPGSCRGISVILFALVGGGLTMLRGGAQPKQRSAGSKDGLKPREDWHAQ